MVTVSAMRCFLDTVEREEPNTDIASALCKTGIWKTESPNCENAIVVVACEPGHCAVSVSI